MADDKPDPDAPSTFKIYGSPQPKAAPQTVFPKAEGNQGKAPAPAPVDPDAPSTFKTYGAPKAAPPPATNDVGNFFSLTGPGWDPSKSQPADLSRPQTWTDWVTRTYSPSMSDVGKAALDDVSFGFADPIQAKLTGENVANIRARTADAQAAMGPMGPVVNALTYAVPSTGVAKGLEAAGAAGRVTGALGRYGAAALEGGTASGVSSVGHQIGDPNHPINLEQTGKDIATGAAFGVGGQAVGDVAAGAVRRVSNYVRGSPGRSGEQWDWRTRAAAGDPTLSNDVALYQATLPRDDPAQPALAKTQTALGQSIEPSLGFRATVGAGGLAASALGLSEGMNFGESIVPGGIGGAATRYFGEPAARGINTIDRNINVGQSLDQLYPALYGPQRTPAGLRPAADTSGWADAIRQLTIGSERPGPPSSQFW